MLDHLLIPVGAKLTIHADSFGDTVENHALGSLDNLRNLLDFTDVYVGERNPCIRFRGPNGQLLVTTSRNDNTGVAIKL